MSNLTLLGGDLHELGLLTEANFRALSGMQESIASNWRKRQVFRTETEMRISVLNDGDFPTRGAKYWQCVREQTVMLDNLAEISFRYRRNEVRYKKLQKQLAEAQSAFEIEEIEIDIDECEYARASLQQNANDRVREILKWAELMLELDDGSFNTKDVDSHQLDSYILALEHRRSALSHSASNQAEVMNVLGPLETALKLAKARKQKVLT